MLHVAVMSVTACIGLMAVFAVDLIFISMLGKPVKTPLPETPQRPRAVPSQPLVKTKEKAI